MGKLLLLTLNEQEETAIDKIISAISNYMRLEPMQLTPVAEWEQTVKNGQKPAEKQHRPPERQSVRNRLRQLQEESKQSSQSKQRKKSQGRDR